MEVILVSFVVVSVYLSSVVGHLHCIDGHGKKGECVPIKECQPIRELLQNGFLYDEDKEFLMLSKCDGNVGRPPFACCASKPVVITTRVTSNWIRSTQQIRPTPTLSLRRSTNRWSDIRPTRSLYSRTLHASESGEDYEDIDFAFRIPIDPVNSAHSVKDKVTESLNEDDVDFAVRIPVDIRTTPVWPSSRTALTSDSALWTYPSFMDATYISASTTKSSSDLRTSTFESYSTLRSTFPSTKRTFTVKQTSSNSLQGSSGPSTSSSESSTLSASTDATQKRPTIPSTRRTFTVPSSSSLQSSFDPSTSSSESYSPIPSTRRTFTVKQTSFSSLQSSFDPRTSSPGSYSPIPSTRRTFTVKQPSSSSLQSSFDPSTSSPESYSTTGSIDAVQKRSTSPNFTVKEAGSTLSSSFDAESSTESMEASTTSGVILNVMGDFETVSTTTILSEDPSTTATSWDKLSSSFGSTIEPSTTTSKTLFNDRVDSSREGTLPMITPTPTSGTTYTSTSLPTIPNNELPVPPLCGSQGLTMRILGGDLADLDEFPWTVLLDYGESESRGVRCGGGLINYRYIVTAAHCVTPEALRVNGGLLGVRLGEYDTSTDPDCIDGDCLSPVLRAGIEEIIVHEGFKLGQRSDDIALLRMNLTVQQERCVQPICLPSLANFTYSLPGTEVMVTGWGKTLESSFSTVKRKLSLNISNMLECVTKYASDGIKILSRQLCAGGVENEDSCGGDSGGPLMRNFNDVWVMEGIVSFGRKECGQAGWPGVYTRIRSYERWIRSHLRP